MVITVSLKEALRERPSAPQAHSRQNGTPARLPRPNYELVPGKKGTYNVVSLWTEQEFRTFRHLIERCASPRVSEAADGRVWLRRFKEQHGEEICDMMLAEIRRRDEIAWFKGKQKFKGA